MQTYCLAGLEIESNIAFPELPAGSGQASVRVLFDADLSLSSRSVGWFRAFEDAAGQAWARIGRTETGYLLRVDDQVDFAIEGHGSQICCHSAAQLPDQLLRELFLDLAFPLAAELNGHCVLHASAVRLGDAVVAFAGPTGVGKSTLAAGLDTVGWGSLADDFLHVSAQDAQAICWPSYPGVRLEPQAAAWVWGDSTPESQQSRWGKRRFVCSPRSVGCEPLYLSAVIALDRSAALRQPKLRRLGMHESYMTLYRNAYHLDPQQAASLARSLHRFGDLAAVLPCFRLSFPDGREWLPQVQASLAPLLTRPHHSAETDQGLGP